MCDYLKRGGVGIQFEKENINTLDNQGEMLLTVLSSLAQAESESLSKNVAMGLKAKNEKWGGTSRFSRLLGGVRL